MTNERFGQLDWSIELGNDLQELEKLALLFGSLLQQGILHDKAAFELNLVCEEIVTNTIMYGYDDEDKHLIRIQLSLSNGVATISIADDGMAFNPLDRKQPDLSLSIEDRPVGGLGLHFVKQLMDETVYERIDGHNLLIMNKRLLPKE